MSLRMHYDLEELKKRVDVLEARGTSIEKDGEDLVTVARKEWNALLARLEKLEARFRRA